MEANAATTKQLDDINAEISITKSQIIATTSTLSTQSQSIIEEVEAMSSKNYNLENALSTCKIKIPTKGTVINKYIQANELFQGKPLFKIADLNNMFIKFT